MKAGRSDATPIRLHHGLRFRIAYGILLPVLISLALLSYLNYVHTRQTMMENLRRSGASASQIIEGSLHHAMLANDFEAVQQIIESIANQLDVQSILLLDTAGRVVISAAGHVPGSSLPISDPVCQTCHDATPARRDESVVLTVDGSRVFRTASSIENLTSCWTCHDRRDKLRGVLVTDFSMADVDRQLASITEMGTLISGASIVVVAVIIYSMMGRLVISRLGQFLAAIRQIINGDLNQTIVTKETDEIGELADVFNDMAAGLREKERLECQVAENAEALQAQAAKLATLNTIAATVGQSLDLGEILDSALAKVIDLMKLKASWIVLWNEEEHVFELAAYRGLPKDVAESHMRCEWQRCICPDVLEKGHPQVFQGQLDQLCPTAEYFRREGLTFRACIPLQSKDRTLGVMSLIGEDSGDLAPLTENTVDTLTAIGREIGMAVENASLYEELREKETRRKELLERIIGVQEQERRRIARELHDQTGQALTSLIMTLKVLEEEGHTPEVHARTQELRGMAAGILNQVRALSLELRPSILDDLGLLAALRHYVKGFQQRYEILVDFQVLGLEAKRLPPDVETALFRIVQEALTNVAMHSKARAVTVLLEDWGATVKLIVEDDGIGFDVASVLGSHPHEGNLGLYGMLERASLLGGSLTMESSPDGGTTVFAVIPLSAKENGYEPDTPVDR